MKNIRQTLKELQFEEKPGYFIRAEEEVIVEIVLISNKILIRIEECLRFNLPKITYIETLSIDRMISVIKEAFLIDDEEEQ